MCGIAGVIHSDPRVAASAIAAADREMAHRGPDDSGEIILPFNGRVLGLGHRRLSIIDLSPLGHQPMVHRGTGCQIVFNGEVYNFGRLRRELEKEGETFRGGSDTEVLLAGLVRYGPAYLRRLDGMFALAFFDPRGPTLLLARDPAGMKPLYLYHSPECVVFASEVRAILATGLVKPVANGRGIRGFLAFGAVQHPDTVFSGIDSLAPASSVTIRGGAAGPEILPPAAYWFLPTTDPRLTVNRAVPAVREALDAAVKDHLVADVPVGLFLSSGIDSCVLAGLAARHHPRMKSYTVVFADQPDYSEHLLAAETASRFGLDHTEIPLSEADAWAAVTDWLASLDQPSVDGLNVFLISRLVRSRGVTVALTGLGGDELFGGYPSFRDVPRLRRAARLAGWLPAPVRRWLAGVLSAGRPVATREKLKDTFGGGRSLRDIYLQRRRVMSDRQLAVLGLGSRRIRAAELIPPDAMPDADAAPVDSVRAISQFEFRLYQGNMLLRDADANGMAASLEIRVPFLDRRVVELAHSIPGSVRLPPGAPGKYLLRRAFADLLPEGVLAQPKRGFSLPLGRWMAGSLRPLCENAIGALCDAGVVDPEGVTSVWREFLAEPDSPMWSRALALVVLGDFWRKTTGGLSRIDR